MRASGGGARSPLWRQIQADVFGVEIVTPHVTEGPAYGACLLAAVGAGVFASVEEACRETIVITDRIEPIEGNRATYARFYPVYRDLYPSLKPHFGNVARLVRGEG